MALRPVEHQNFIQTQCYNFKHLSIAKHKHSYSKLVLATQQKETTIKFTNVYYISSTQPNTASHRMHYHNVGSREEEKSSYRLIVGRTQQGVVVLGLDLVLFVLRLVAEEVLHHLVALLLPHHLRLRRRSSAFFAGVWFRRNLGWS